MLKTFLIGNSTTHLDMNQIKEVDIIDLFQNMQVGSKNTIDLMCYSTVLLSTQIIKKVELYQFKNIRKI